MENKNSYTREAFIKELGHARKAELANMIMDGATYDEMYAAGYSRINVQEMYSQVKLNVAGMEDLKLEVPRTAEETAARDEQVAAANTDSEKKIEGQASVQGQTAGEATAPDATDPAAPESAPSADVNAAPAVDANAPGTEPGYDETLGGNQTPHNPEAPTAPETPVENQPTNDRPQG